VIHSAVGAINESDIELADASKAVIIGFNVVPDESARAMAEQRHIEIRLYRVIYEILDDLKKALSGMLEPEIREKLHGHAEVRQIFTAGKTTIAGCIVLDGVMRRGAKARLLRGGGPVWEGSIGSLRRVKDDVREVNAGLECGIILEGTNEVLVGDAIEAFVVQAKARE
jgi:translation initiation factor IF-2